MKQEEPTHEIFCIFMVVKYTSKYERIKKDNNNIPTQV